MKNEIKIEIIGESSRIARILDLMRGLNLMSGEIPLGNVGEDKKEEILGIIRDLIAKIGEKHGIVEENVRMYRYYGNKSKVGGPSGIRIIFNSFSSDIKGTLLIGFTGNEIEAYYIFYTHIDYLGSYVSEEYNEFTRKLRADAKENGLKMNTARRYEMPLIRSDESPFTNPIFYRRDRCLNLGRICDFIKSIENIGRKYPLFGESIYLF